MHTDQTDDGKPLRVYRTDERERRPVIFFIAAVGGLFLAITLAEIVGILPHRGPLSGFFLGDLMMGGIFVTLGSFWNKRAIFRQHSIEVVGWFYSRKLDFTEIRGRQTTANSRRPYGYAHVLIPTDSRKRKLILPRVREDQFFRDWLKTIPKVPR